MSKVPQALQPRDVFSHGSSWSTLWPPCPHPVHNAISLSAFRSPIYSYLPPTPRKYLRTPPLEPTAQGDYLEDRNPCTGVRGPQQQSSDFGTELPSSQGKNGKKSHKVFVFSKKAYQSFKKKTYSESNPERTYPGNPARLTKSNGFRRAESRKVKTALERGPGPCGLSF